MLVGFSHRVYSPKIEAFPLVAYIPSFWENDEHSLSILDAPHTKDVIDTRFV